MMDILYFLLVGLACFFAGFNSDLILLDIINGYRRSINDKRKTLSFLSESWKGMCNRLIGLELARNHYEKFIYDKKEGLYKRIEDLEAELKKSQAFVKYYEAKCDAMKANCCAFCNAEETAMKKLNMTYGKFAATYYDTESKYPIPSNYIKTDETN